MENKQEILGQYFTKIEIVRRVLDLLFSYKKYDNKIKILVKILTVVAHQIKRLPIK